MTKGHQVFLVLVVSALVFASSADASTFNVNPIQLHLSEGGSSTLRTVHNTSEEEIRFQLTTYAWSQGADGRIQLEPTNDIVFFPRMIQLAPGTKRKVRIGLARATSKNESAGGKSAGDKKVGSIEHTYRILVEELPSRKTKKDAEQIQILTRMSVPIFVEPTTPMVKLSIGHPSVERGRFRFDLQNDGTVHTMLRKIKVTAVSSGHKELFSRELAGWYLLARGIRTYEIEIPRALCSKIAYFKVSGGTEGDKPLSLKYDAPPGTCSTQ